MNGSRSSSANVSSSELERLAPLEPKRAAALLAELANSELAKFPYITPQQQDHSLARLQRRFRELFPMASRAVANVVRRAWEQPTIRGRDDLLLSALVEAVHGYEQASREAPPSSVGPALALEAEKWHRIIVTLWAAAKLTHRMRICANPECPAGCFVAEKKNQRYCSEKCAGAGARELKRLWWGEHGPAWREARKKAKPKRRRGKRTKP